MIFDCPVIKVGDDIIDDIYNGQEIIYDNIDIPLGSYALFSSFIDNKKNAIVWHSKPNAWQLKRNKKEVSFLGLKPKDLQQKVLFDLLGSKPLTVILGTAGTGKTTIALAYALDKYTTQRKKIILIKPTVQVGKSKAFGAVPGDIEQKYAPFLLSYEIVLKNLLTKNSSDYIKKMIDAEELKFIPLELLRGTTLDNATVILDEAQDTTWHELNTLISRIGDTSELLILGDLSQIDTGLKKEETGLYQMLSSDPFLNSELKSTIELIKQYRSPIVKLANDINTWILNKKK